MFRNKYIYKFNDYTTATCYKNGNVDFCYLLSRPDEHIYYLNKGITLKRQLIVKINEILHKEYGMTHY